MKTLELNNTSMIELSSTELRQTEGGYWIIILAAVSIYSAGYAIGYCITHDC